jgi:hypothetical protein
MASLHRLFSRTPFLFCLPHIEWGKQKTLIMNKDQSSGPQTGGPLPALGFASPASETSKRLRHKASVRILIFFSCTDIFLFIVFCITRIYSVSFWTYSVANPE